MTWPPTSGEGEVIEFGVLTALDEARWLFTPLPIGGMFTWRFGAFAVSENGSWPVVEVELEPKKLVVEEP